MINNLELIAAIGQNNELGFNKQLIWKIKDDLQQFKKLTIGKNMIMGYNTYLSMPKNLIDRNYIVLTHRDITIDGVSIYHSKETLCNSFKDNEKYIIIGGAQIYKLFLDDVNIMYLTKISASFKEADTYFPKFSEKQFDEYLIFDGSSQSISFKQYKYVRRNYDR